ncbi:hypothetical protein [Thiomicrorhabdus arctica]|jgi:hypothetical protein|uniref:hypothetical protein n=1 Tax=Thiomicrorhabdus arctica TaxID=131540 RepID=UPI0003623813|nr:hypothetical protein [Thiomicrorhabdus arctica]
MIYIERNALGEIDNIEFTPAKNREEISLHDPQLTEFIKKSADSEAIMQSVLDRLDLDMVRVIEDLIDIMIERDLIRFTDLPQPVQNKLLFKRKIRNMGNEISIIDDNELLNL